MSETKQLQVPDRESIRVLLECIELQAKKSRDYQNPLSTVKQADHYPHGIQTIMDMVHQKLIRYKSLIETMEADPTATPNFESLEDTLKDAINYLSFGVSWLRFKMEGQNGFHDIFNRPLRVPIKTLVTDPDGHVITEESDK